MSHMQYTILAMVIGLLLPLGYGATLYLAGRRLHSRKP